jgi:hypothetical protein
MRTTFLPKKGHPELRERTRYLQRPNRSERPCGKACRIEEAENHKVPPAYSRAEEGARSLNGRRDDGWIDMGYTTEAAAGAVPRASRSPTQR